MKISSKKISFPLFLLLIGGMINTSSVSLLFHLDDDILKLFGSLLIFLSTLNIFKFNSIKINDSGLYIVFIMYASFVFSEIFIAQDINGSIKSLIRLILAVDIYLLSKFIVSHVDPKMIINHILVVGFIVVLFAFIYFLFDVERGEYIQVLGIYSHKGIVHEINVFGIIAYLMLLISGFILSVSTRLYGYLIFAIAIILSYYRTVYLLLIMYFISPIRIAVLLFLGLIIIGVNDNLGNVLYGDLALHQAASLTGRDELWLIGMKTFVAYPLGAGESQIPAITAQVNHYYTTLHNSVFDAMVMGGIVGLISYISVIAYFGVKNYGGNKWFYLLIILPAFMNTYYPFAPNLP